MPESDPSVRWGDGQWCSRATRKPANGARVPRYSLLAPSGLGKPIAIHSPILFMAQDRAFRDPDWRAERLLAAAVER